VPETSLRPIWWGTTALSLVALLLVVGNILLAIDIQQRQAEVNQRQQFINQSIQLSRANQLLINALAQIAAKNGDAEIRDLLAANGITFSISNPASAALPSKPAAK
jgi:hypothetical protein